MPIKGEGTVEHAHYRAVYENFLKPELQGLGYSVIRADDIQKAGAITKDIVVHIVEADLVIADLTDLNPNVFYELGARHALRGRGTIMLLDENKTPDIPFDLSAYRIIKFRGDVVGIGPLRTQLTKFVEQLRLNSDSIDYRDNPIHDWLPWLPINAIDKSTDTVEAKLRGVISQLNEQILAYQTKFGDLSDDVGSINSDPLEIISTAISEAESGDLPANIINDAREATQQRDVKKFLDAVQRGFKAKRFYLTTNHILELSAMSSQFGSSDITKAIVAFGRRNFPTDKKLRFAELSEFCHSEEPKDREMGRIELAKDLGIDLGAVDGWQLDFTKYDPLLFGIMLDAYAIDEMYTEALNLTSNAIKLYPDKTILIRNHAKFLGLLGQGDESLSWHRKSIFCPDADDVSIEWFGNELHNRGQYVDALEVYLLSCLQDPDDATYFAHLADEIALALGYRTPSQEKKRERILPNEIGKSEILLATAMCASCSSVSAHDLEYIDRALRKIGANVGTVMAQIQENGYMPLDDRVSVVERWYGLLKSSLTYDEERIVN